MTVLVHLVLGALGATFSYFVVGEVWVRADTIVAMWVAVVVCLGLAALAASFRQARGAAAGVAASALVFGYVFTVVSRGPALP